MFEDVGFDVGRGERLLIMGLNGAGKTSLLRILTGETAADRGTFTFGYGVEPGYYAQEHEGIRDGIAVLAHMKAESGADDQALRSLLGMFGLSGRDGVPGRRHALGRARRRSSPSRSWWPAGRTCSCSMSPRTTSIHRRRTAIAEALQDWPGAMVIVSHDTEFVEALAPQRVLLMPDGTLDYWDEDLLDLVALA